MTHECAQLLITAQRASQEISYISAIEILGAHPTLKATNLVLLEAP